MKLNVSFNNATIYGFDTLEVVVGEKFKIFVDEFQPDLQVLILVRQLLV